ncbi:MAG: hypothetical protein WCJ69_00530 [Betaproteobacteria bacterium]
MHSISPETGTARSSDLMRTLTAIEAGHPVRDWQVDGLPVWPLIRLRWVFAEWARLYTGMANPVGAGTALRRMLVGVLEQQRARREDRNGEDRGPARRDIVFHSDGLSMARLGSTWVERFCDPLRAAADTLGLSSLCLTPLHKRHRPRAGASRWIQPGIDLSNLGGALRSRLWPPGAQLPALETVCSELERGGFKTTELARSRILFDAGRLLAVSNYYSRFLRRAQPRLAFVVGYYSLEGMAFVLACKRVEVRVFDLQHGVQGNMHPAYAAWPTTHNNEVHTLLPDGFWVWSDWEAATIRGWAQGRAHQAVVGGNPWMDLWSPDSEWPGVAEARQRVAVLKAQALGRPILLVTLQYGLQAQEQLEPLAKLMRHSKDKFMWWVRLHPAMLDRYEEVVSRLAETGAPHDITLSTDLPLQALLPMADLHLTHSSTTVIEAEQFGLRSVLTSAYGAELFPRQLAAGVAKLEEGGAGPMDAAISALLAERAAIPHSQVPLATVDTLKLLLQPPMPQVGKQ